MQSATSTSLDRPSTALLLLLRGAGGPSGPPCSAYRLLLPRLRALCDLPRRPPAAGLARSSHAACRVIRQPSRPCRADLLSAASRPRAAFPSCTRDLHGALVYRALPAALLLAAAALSFSAWSRRSTCAITTFVDLLAGWLLAPSPSLWRRASTASGDRSGTRLRASARSHRRERALGVVAIQGGPLLPLTPGRPAELRGHRGRHARQLRLDGGPRCRVEAAQDGGPRV